MILQGWNNGLVVSQGYGVLDVVTITGTIVVTEPAREQVITGWSGILAAILAFGELTDSWAIVGTVSGWTLLTPSAATWSNATAAAAVWTSPSLNAAGWSSSSVQVTVWTIDPTDTTTWH